jgi:hypothetical protein
MLPYHETSLCSLCLCVRRNVPTAHDDAMQGCSRGVSLNTEDTETQRTQRKRLSNLEDKDPST